MKLRLRRPGGELVSLDESIQVSLLLKELWALKDDNRVTGWHGLKVTLDKQGKCKVDFNYDPECAKDPFFFDD